MSCPHDTRGNKTVLGTWYSVADLEYLLHCFPWELSMLVSVRVLEYCMYLTVAFHCSPNIWVPIFKPDLLSFVHHSTSWRLPCWPWVSSSMPCLSCKPGWTTRTPLWTHSDQSALTPRPSKSSWRNTTYVSAPYKLRLLICFLILWLLLSQVIIVY